MADRKNLKIGVESYEKHSAKKSELGLTWEEYLDLAHDALTIEEAAREGAREGVKAAMGGRNDG